MDERTDGSIAGEKDRIRRTMRRAIAQIGHQAAGELSAQLCERFLAHELFRTHGALVVFAPLEGEPDITGIAAAAFVDGRTVAAPRIDWDERTMEAAEITGFGEELVTGRYGVREPAPEAAGVRLEEVGLVLAPGLAFDEWGRRIGRGAGYYDRFLGALRAANPEAVAVGVLFDEQIEPDLPEEAGDERVDALATPTRVVWPLMG